MAVTNFVKSLREVLGVTQEELGERLGGLSVSQVAKLEAEPTRAQAESLLNLAERAGAIEHVLYFRRLLGQEDEEKGDAGALGSLKADERELAKAVIEMHRSPDPGSVIERNIGAIIWELRSRQPQMPDWLSDLNEEQVGILQRLARDPETIKIVATILSGGRPAATANRTGANQPLKRKIGN